MIFTHHPPLDEQWTYDPDRVYEQHLGPKPRGLWLSVDDDWRRWCEGEQWNVPLADSITFEVDIEACLWLSTAEHIDEFSNKYVGPDLIDSYRVNWQPLVDSYAGLIIAPYIWERRLSMDKTGWYYGWDCASACVWDLKVLKPV